MWSLLDPTITPRSLHAEADGNRTRLGAFAPTPVLKTGGPTRRPDASACEDSVQPLPSDWKLKVSPENGRLEVEFEVDQNVSGDRWRVRIRHDGDLAFRGIRITRDASGSFEVRIVENDMAGPDAFRARVRNLSTDEVCVGRATF
jgi:hypothetical protein